MLNLRSAHDLRGAHGGPEHGPHTGRDLAPRVKVLLPRPGALVGGPLWGRSDQDLSRLVARYASSPPAGGGSGFFTPAGAVRHPRVRTGQHETPLEKPDERARQDSNPRPTGWKMNQTRDGPSAAVRLVLSPQAGSMISFRPVRAVLARGGHSGPTSAPHRPHSYLGSRHSRLIDCPRKPLASAAPRAVGQASVQGRGRPTCTRFAA